MVNSSARPEGTVRGFSWLVYAPRELKTSTRQIDSVTIVDLSGRITLGEASVVVRDVVNDQTCRDCQKNCASLCELASKETDPEKLANRENRKSLQTPSMKKPCQS